jgi:hypothetical protein
MVVEQGQTDRVKNEEVLHGVKEDRNILHTTKRRKANWIGHILRKNCLLKHVIEGMVEKRITVTGNEEEDVISFWLALRKTKYNGI